MNMKLATFIIACLCLGFFAVPVLADDAASNAVKQCYQNMQSVHSYRTKTVTLIPSFPQGDDDTVTEETEEPRMLHSITKNASAKYENESVHTEDAFYYRFNRGPWSMQTRSKDSPTKIDKSVAGADGSQTHVQVVLPVHDAPWGSIWKKEYDPHATYIFVRKDLLDSVPVDVYSTNGVDDGQQTDTEIWIGVKDHLLHEVLTHSIQKDKIEHYSTETLSDFNAPIKIDVPDVAPSDSTTPETKSDGSH